MHTHTHNGLIALPGPLKWLLITESSLISYWLH